jgi:hypothetical protein
MKEINAKINTKHGYSKHPIFGVWKNMIDRCYNENNVAYLNYGGRGITVCSKWKHDVSSFIEWAEKNDWRQGLEIDRKNNNGNYNPTNCRFVTSKVNSNNRRSTIIVTVKGKTLPLTEAIEKYSKRTYRQVYNKFHYSNWPIEQALGIR